MLNNYLKIAFRNILNQKLFSFINILSLAVGLTCSILLGLYVTDELSFDKFNQNKNSIYRILQVNNLPDGSLQYEGIHHAIALGPTLAKENPVIEKSIRFFQPWADGKYYIKQGNKSFHDKVLYADFEVFDVFSFPILKGNIEKNNINTVAISETSARKYFGYQDPINKPLEFRIEDQYVSFTVAAVFKDIPANSSVQFNVLLPFSHVATVGELNGFQDHWGFGAIITYLKLRDGVDPKTLDSGLAKLMATHYPQYKEIAKEQGFASAYDYRHFRLEPLTDIHFNSQVFEGLAPSSNPIYSYILLGLSLVILTIACFNFMNLSISRSANRVKEVGLRKAIGALRKQLITQFVGESILLSLLAFCISFLLVDLLLPTFNYLVDKHIEMSHFISWQSIVLMIALCLLVGILAGLYPALVISQFSIRDTLTSSNQFGKTNWFTTSLITLQFALSVILIIGMIVINKQVDYLRNKNLGFDTSNILVFNNSKIDDGSIYSRLKVKATNYSGILSMTSASQSFADPSGLGGRGFTYKGERKRVGIIEVSENYLETFDIKLVDGQGFNNLNTTAVIVNEACIKDFELSVNDTFEALTRSPETDPKVVGVMGDFNYSTLKMGILPMLIRPSEEENLSYIFIKISANQASEVLSFLQSQWLTIAPDLPFEYNFLDETMRAQYMLEEKWEGIMNYAMAIATILSCLGLFGIVALGMESKKKEIGIRKILGAQVQQIVWLFTNSYLKLVLIAFLLAAPVSYYLINEWLATFAYRIEIKPGIFASAAAIIVVVALATITLKVLNAALRNPVEALRSD